MTNEIMAAAPVLTGSDATQAMTLCVRMVDPISISAVAWLISIILMPALSAAVFVQGIVARRRGRAVSWHPRALLLAGLIASTSTMVAAITTLHDGFYFAATHTWGEAQQAMLRINVAHACSVLRAGILAAAFSVGLALVLPRGRKEPPTTGGTVRR